MRKLIPFLFASAVGFILLTSGAVSPNGKAGATGSPGEQTCNQSACHTGTAVNAGGGSVVISSSNLVNWEYTPGTSYTITVTVAETGRSLFGLGFEALKSNGDNGGTLVIGTGTHILNKTVSGFTRKNIVHFENAGATANSHAFTFTWNAPATDVGNVTFYCAGNAADGDDDNLGDHIYSTSQVVTPAPVGVNENTVVAREFSIYPNPAVSELSVEFFLSKTAKVEGLIHSMDGKTLLVDGGWWLVAGEYSKRIDVSGLAAGNYVFLLKVDGKVIGSKSFSH